ncbi:MAG TPA: HEAT repeat domain-containing protein [Gemmataceae bacterium]|nr:HEAT repeat domain-containing protein [Gemmataceae bacterium]
MPFKAPMLISALAGLALAAWTPFTFAPQSPKTPPVSEAEIKKLIAQLDNSSFKVREEALSKLAEIGPPALPALRQVAKNGSEGARQRAAVLIEKCHVVKMKGLTFKLVVPRNVSLKKGKGSHFVVKLEISNTTDNPCWLALKDKLYLRLKDKKGPDVFNGGVSKQHTFIEAEDISLAGRQSDAIFLHVLVSPGGSGLRFAWVDPFGGIHDANRDCLGPYEFSVMYSNFVQDQKNGIPYWLGDVEAGAEPIVFGS